MLVTSDEVLSEAGSEPLVAVEEEIERNIDDDDSYDPNDDFETESEDTPFRGDRCPKYEEYLTCGCQTTWGHLVQPNHAPQDAFVKLEKCDQLTDYAFLKGLVQV